MRAAMYGSTVCYLKKDNQILFLKFNKKWGQVYAPPGGKVDFNETPTECIKREFFEETGLTLIEPKLKGISYWKNSEEGLIFIYVADKYSGEIEKETIEGKLEWIDIDKISSLKQFDMNSKFTNRIFKPGLFEGKFILNDDNSVKEYNIIDI